MTEVSRFWDGTTVGDAATVAPYDAPTEFSKVMMAISGADGDTNKGGVWITELGELVATNPASTTVRIASGRAQVWGTWYENDANVDTTPAAPGASTRIDRYVLRKNWAAQTVRVFRIAGVEGAGAPALVQSVGVTWDYPIVQASTTTGGVVTLTDQRTYLGGFVNPMTTLGDLIKGGASGVAARFALGTALHVPQVNSGGTDLAYAGPVHLAAWTGFTPTVTQTVSVTITVVHARYAVVGKIALVEMKLGITSSGTSGGIVKVGAIPAAITPKYTDAFATAAIGTAVIYPGSGNVRLVAVTPNSTTEWWFFADNSGGSWFGSSPSVQLINTGVISMNLMYEID